MRRINCYIRVSLTFVFILNASLLFGQFQPTVHTKLSLLFIGDIMGHDEQIWSAEDRETHMFNYDTVFSFIKPVLSEADIAIANFEVTLAGPPYTGYPRFSSPAALAAACKNAGIDYFATANNHAADRGTKGIISTINKLDSVGIPHTGTFVSQSSRDSLSPFMIYRNGISLALLNYTFSTNGINVPRPAIVNMLDKNLIAFDVKKAREKKPDAVILFLHWGNEYDTIPNKTQTDLAEYFFSIGVDLVIGSHPHVLQKMIWTKYSAPDKDKFAAFSLGNFLSNQRKPKTDGGTIVRVEIEKTGNSVKISDAGYLLTWVYTPIEKYRKKFFILPCSQFENNKSFFANPVDYSLMMKFLTDSRALLNGQNKNVSEYRFDGTSVVK